MRLLRFRLSPSATAQSLGSLFAALSASAFLSLVALMLMTRTMAPAAVGGYMLFKALLDILTYTTDVSTQRSFTHFVSRRETSVAEALTYALLISATIGAAVLIVFILSGEAIAPVIGLPLMVMAVLVIALPLAIQQEYVLGVLRGLRQFGRYSLSFVSIEWSSLSRFLRFGGKNYLTLLVGWLHYRLDIVLVGLLLSPIEVAFYGLAVTIAERLWLAADVVGIYLLPELSPLKTEEAQVHTARAVRRVALVVSAIVSMVALGGWLLSPLVFGQAYQSSLLPLYLLLPGVLAMSLVKVVQFYFVSRERQEVVILNNGLAVCLNVALNLVLIPSYSVVGAAFVSTLSYTLFLAGLLYRFRRDRVPGLVEPLLPRRRDLEDLWGAFVTRR
ncbi:MAG: polysaccharide biosynthesis C-terminal domain-containing protein [Chloroflexi bacterium]|nr:polysaccharide biosynthesis C-terminal domain-containing protein [Chloroflexota bacterium]